MKALAFALPWLLVAVAALVFAWVMPDKKPEETLFYYNFKNAAAAMLLGGLLVWFGRSVAEGMEEGLKARQRGAGPGRTRQ